MLPAHLPPIPDPTKVTPTGHGPRPTCAGRPQPTALRRKAGSPRAAMPHADPYAMRPREVSCTCSELTTTAVGFCPDARGRGPLRGSTIVSYRTPSRRAPVAVSPPRPARLGRETCARGTAAAGLRATRPTRGSPRSRRQKHLPAGWYCP